MARRICCPNIFCRSTNIVPVSTKTKFSVGRAVVGGTVGSLFNPLGTIIGAASGINGKRGKTKEPLNKSPAAGQRVFCSHAAG